MGLPGFANRLYPPPLDPSVLDPSRTDLPRGEGPGAGFFGAGLSGGGLSVVGAGGAGLSGVGAAPSWAELAAGLQHRLGPAADWAALRLVFVVRDMVEACAALAYGVAGRLDCGVIAADRLTPGLEARFAALGIGLLDLAGARLLSPPDLPPPDLSVAPEGPTSASASASASGADAGAAGVVPGRLTVLTSGTTGPLKLIGHDLASLDTFGRLAAMAPQRWFLPYQIGSYAWYQMAALSLFVPGQDLVLSDGADPLASFEAALRQGGVSAISSTPSFWRHALMGLDPDLLAAAPLQSLTLGGEIVDQAILDRLATLYPAARIRHIYASSEAGAAIVVSDGRAGFPAAYLARRDGPVALRIEAGRLFLRSRYGHRAAAGQWIDSGDLVERRGERVLFLGRADGAMINVGGQKAFAPDIEAHLLGHPAVLWARVRARRAPLLGQLPVASVVLRQPMAEAMLTAHCQAGLAEHAIPRLWEFPAEVPLAASLKS